MLSEKDGVVPIPFEMFMQPFLKISKNPQEKMFRNDVHAVIRNLSEPLSGNEIHDFRFVSKGAEPEKKLVVLLS